MKYVPDGEKHRQEAPVFPETGWKRLYHSTWGKILEVFAFGAAGIFLLLLFSIPMLLHMDACPLHALTGLDCPSCGMTRAVFSLLHGDFAAAFDYNLLWPLTLTLLLILPTLYLTGRFLGRKIIPPFLLSLRFWIIVFIFYIAFGIIRNLPIDALRWLTA